MCRDPYAADAPGKDVVNKNGTGAETAYARNLIKTAFKNGNVTITVGGQPKSFEAMGRQPHAGVNPEEMKLRTQHAGLSQWRQMVRPTLVWAVDTPPAAPRPLCGQAPGTGTPHACPAGCGAWRSEAGECRAGTADPIWIMMWPLLESVVATIAHVQPTPRTQSGWYCGHC